MKALKYTGVIASGVLIIAALFYVSKSTKGTSQANAIHQISAVTIPVEEKFHAWLEAPAEEKQNSAYIDEGVQIAIKRKANIKRLIATNPQKALDESLSPEQWSALPDEVKPHVEQHFSMVANVEFAIGCGPNFVSKQLHTRLDDGTYLSLFPAPGNRFLRSVQNVSVSGIRIDDIAAIYNAYIPKEDTYSESRITQTSHLPGGDNAHTMYVIKVEFSDLAADPVDPTTLEDLINNDVSQQIYAMSNHLQWVDCTVDTTTYLLPETMAYYESNLWQIHDDAVTEAAIDINNYDTVCVLFADYSGFEFAGIAIMPGTKMLINGYQSANFTRTAITHELGHNLGSDHASSWDVTTADPDDAGGELTEYGNTTDIMGFGGLPKGHFNVLHKLDVGWFDGTNFTDVTTSGTYRVYRSDHPETDLTVGAVRGLRIAKNGAGDYYWLGYRQLYDNLENFGRGLYVLWDKDTDNKSYLLDMTPGSEADGTDAEKEDGGLRLGTTYSDTVASPEVHITPIARGGWEPDQYMDVVINLGDFSGNNAPIASESWPTAGNARESLVFEVSASDSDGDDLAYSWDFGDGLIKPNSPIVSHAWAIGGSYTVSCTVTDMKGGTDTVSETVVVSDGLESAWLEQNANTSSDLFDITEGNGTLVVVGHGGFVATSTDGASWTTRDLDINFTGNYFLTSVIYDGSHFVTVGFNFAGFIEGQPNFVGLVYTSPDGITWTQQHYGGKNLEDVAYHDGVYLAVGDASTVLKSVDRETWVSVVPGISGDFKSIVHSGTTFIAAGSSQVVMTSTDGNSWTQSMDGFYPNFYELENLNGRIFGGGYGNGIYETVNEGSSFDPLLEDTIEIGGFCFGNGIYFAAGSDTNVSNVDLNFLSANGTDWLELTTAAQADRNAAIFFDNAIITVGASGSVWKSPTVQVTDDGYGSWELFNRSELGLNRDSMDDADCDGAKNLLEYALGTDATDPSSVPFVSTSKDGTGRLVIYVPRTRNALDLNYIVEQSTGLGESAVWSDADTEVVSESENEIVYRTVDPLSSISPQFLRLRVEIAPPGP